MVQDMVCKTSYLNSQEFNSSYYEPGLNSCEFSYETSVMHPSLFFNFTFCSCQSIISLIFVTLRRRTYHPEETVQHPMVLAPVLRQGAIVIKTRRPVKARLFVEELEGRFVLSAATAVQNLLAARAAAVAPSAVQHSHSAVVNVAQESTNWSGYAVALSNVTTVTGTWIVPTVSGSGSTYSSVWVGIDGYSSTSVEQIGTEQDVSNGKATYYAWYEMYPQNPVNVSLAVSPGQEITAQVSYTASNKFTLIITNDSTGKSVTTTQTLANAQRSSAEWIVEAPSSFSVLPLANFGKVSFLGASAKIGATTGPIDDSVWASDVYPIDMISNSGTLLDSASALTDSGSPSTSSFVVTYSSTSPGTGSTSPGTGSTSPGTGTTPPSPSWWRHHWQPTWGSGWRLTEIVASQDWSSHLTGRESALQDFLFASDGMFGLPRRV